MMKLSYKLVENEQELQGAYAVRKQVFTGEQGISEDLVLSGEANDTQIDMVVKDGAAVIGTARVVFPARDTAKIERMAVLKNYRNRGIGKGIISFLNEELERRHIKHVILHAQYQVTDFYRACGFSESGLPFNEAGIKHVKMEMHY